MYFEQAIRLLDFKYVLYINTQFLSREVLKLSNQLQKQDLKHRISMMEQEILNLTGPERTKAKDKYQKLLKSYSKECGLEESIYLTRA